MGKSNRKQKRAAAARAGEPPTGAAPAATEPGPAPEKPAMLGFIVIFAAVIGAFYLVYVSELGDAFLVAPITKLSAAISSGLLGLFADDVASNGATVRFSGTAVSIARGCDGLEPMALFVAAVLAFPRFWSVKVHGLVAGLALLFAANQVRIISLVLARAWAPEAFDELHVVVWQFVFIVLALGSWMLWLRWASRRDGRSKAASGSGL